MSLTDLSTFSLVFKNRLYQKSNFLRKRRERRFMASLLLTNDSVRVVQPKVSKEFGERQAKLLQQVHFWIQNQNNKGTINNGKKWVYNTYEDWAEQIGVSVASIGRYFYYLKKRGVILSDFLNHRRSERTKYYTINYDRLNEIFGETSEEFYPKKDAKTLILSGSSTQNDRIYIQREHTKINTILSEGEPSKDLVNFCDNFKNLAKEDVSNQTPLNIQEETLQDNSSQEETFVKEELSQPKILRPNNQKIQQETSKLKETHPFQPLTKDNQTGQMASEILTKLLEIYNQEVGTLTGLVTLNKDRARFLMAGFIKKFEKNLNKWRTFCKSITSSDFLMGNIKKDFKLSFDWVLKFTTIDRFLNGEFGITQTLSHLEALEKSQKEHEIEVKNHDNFPELRAQILEELGAGVYEETFKNCTFDTLETVCAFTGETEVTLIVEAPNKEEENHIRWNYLQTYLSLSRIKGEARTVKLDKVLSESEKQRQNQENRNTFEVFSTWKNKMTLEEQNELLKANRYNVEAEDLFGKAALFNLFKEYLKEERRAA